MCRRYIAMSLLIGRSRGLIPDVVIFFRPVVETTIREHLDFGSNSVMQIGTSPPCYNQLTHGRPRGRMLRFAQASRWLLFDDRAAEVTELSIVLALVVTLSIPIIGAIGVKVLGYYTSFAGLLP